MATRDRAPRAATPWGEGVHDMSWRDILAIDDWACCGPDHYLRLFPRLLPRAGAVPDGLVRHLAECLAVRAWRLWKGHGLAEELASLDRAEIDRIGHRRCADWFVDRRPLLARVVRQRAAETDVARDRAMLHMLDRILVELRGGRHGAGDEQTFAWFAFLTGIHPGYLWPAALACHERSTALGWLGYLARGRRALMPDDVADYLTDVLDDSPGQGVTIRDPSLSPFLAGIDLGALMRTARSRRRHAMPHLGRSLPRLLPAARRLAFWPPVHRSSAAGR